MKRCQNEIYHIKIKNPLKCHAKPTKIYNKGTPHEIILCDDCANGGTKLIDRATNIFMRLLK